MALNMSISVLISLFFSLQTEIGCDGVRIEINPEHLMATTENTVHISCLSDQEDVNLKKVTMIEVSRNDKSPIACLHHCTTITYGEDATSQFKAVGYLGKDSSESYMNLTLVNPTSEDTGIYTCTVYYFEQTGVKVETASSNLLIEILNDIKDKILILEEKSKDLNEKARALEEETKTQSHQITGLNDTVTYRSAFSASNINNLITTTSGKVLILPDIIMQEGTGYDPNTGVFTAPRSGLYVFHAVVRADTACYYFNLHLMANEKVLAKLGMYDKYVWEQSSISSVVDLETGDRVFPLMKDNSCEVHNDLYTVFTGYLIKAS